MKWLFESRAGQGKPPRLAVAEHRGGLVCCWTEPTTPTVVHVAWSLRGPLAGVLWRPARTVVEACRELDLIWMQSHG